MWQVQTWSQWSSTDWDVRASFDTEDAAWNYARVDIAWDHSPIRIVKV